MGAVRVVLRGGEEDVFTDEEVGGDEFDVSLTRFDFGYEVSVVRGLAVTVTQLFHDRRYCPDVRPVSCVQVAYYRPREWLTVTKE